MEYIKKYWLLIATAFALRSFVNHIDPQNIINF